MCIRDSNWSTSPLSLSDRGCVSFMTSSKLRDVTYCENANTNSMSEKHVMRASDPSVTQLPAPAAPRFPQVASGFCNFCVTQSPKNKLIFSNCVSNYDQELKYEIS